MLRSMLAVMGGFIAISFVIGVLSVIAGTAGSHSLWLRVVFSFMAAGAGGFVAGLIAHRRPVEHGAVLGCLMLVMGAVSYARLKVAQPGWYSLLLVLAPPACAVAGAAIFAYSARRAER